MAEEVHIHYMKIVPDDLACTWIHGTQQKIGEIFREAAKKAPTLLFFDEFDAMVPQRSGDEANEHLNGEVNEFLCMLNNATERGIYVMAATNHPERIDKAVLRTGRIDELIYIDIPDLEARESLFSLCLSKLPVETDINYQQLANLTDGYTCSDISYIVKSAARKMFNATIRSKTEQLCPITQALLEEIISTKQSSVNRKDLRAYERIHILYLPDPQDTNFLLLTIPNIFEADDDHFTAGLLISERINSSLKYVKAYFYEEHIWLFYERELTGQEDMETLLRSMIYQLCQAYTFAQKAIEDFEQMKAEYQEE